VDLLPWFLFAHILGAIIAFGPTFSFPIIGRLGGMEPQHANFATRGSEMISKVQVTPFAILQGITGIGIVLTAKIDIFKTPWLLVAIALYLTALSYAIFVQSPTVKRVIEMTSGGPPPGPPPAGAPAGPPPELLALVRKVQRGGMFLAGLIVVIVLLMVLKPTF
jgi:predicted integral membrane protein DUF2269